MTCAMNMSTIRDAFVIRNSTALMEIMIVDSRRNSVQPLTGFRFSNIRRIMKVIQATTASPIVKMAYETGQGISLVIIENSDIPPIPAITLSGMKMTLRTVKR